MSATPTHEDDGRPRHRAAACGAWQHADGTNAHELCTGAVALPAPRDRCSCPCHVCPTA